MNEVILYAPIGDNELLYVRNIFLEDVGQMQSGEVYVTTLDDIAECLAWLPDSRADSNVVNFRSTLGGKIYLELNYKRNIALSVARPEAASLALKALGNLLRLCSTNGNVIALDESKLYNMVCYARPRITFTNESEKPAVSFSNQESISEIIDASLKVRGFSARCNAVMYPDIVSRMTEPNCKTYVNLLLGVDEYAIFVRRTNLMFSQLRKGWNDDAAASS
jgi:hypothetical protein